jgi:hypothetical protein
MILKPVTNFQQRHSKGMLSGKEREEMKKKGKEATNKPPQNQQDPSRKKGNNAFEDTNFCI